ITGTVNPGGTYPFSASIFIDGTWTEYVNVYIDWNRDFTFSPTERYDIGTCNASGCVVSNNITVPANATPGPVRMRVFLRFNQYQTLPCETTFQFGEVEDYTLNVIPLSGRDAAMASLI